MKPTHEITFDVHGRLNDVDEYRANLVHHIGANFSITVQGVEGRGNSKAEAVASLRTILEALHADQWHAIAKALAASLTPSDACDFCGVPLSEATADDRCPSAHLGSSLPESST